MTKLRKGIHVWEVGVMNRINNFPTKFRLPARRLLHIFVWRAGCTILEKQSKEQMTRAVIALKKSYFALAAPPQNRNDTVLMSLSLPHKLSPKKEAPKNLVQALEKCF